MGAIFGHAGLTLLCPAQLFGTEQWSDTKIWGGRGLLVVGVPTAVGVGLAAGSIGLVLAGPCLLGRMLKRRIERWWEQKHRQRRAQQTLQQWQKSVQRVPSVEVTSVDSNESVAAESATPWMHYLREHGVPPPPLAQSQSQSPHHSQQQLREEEQARNEYEVRGQVEEQVPPLVLNKGMHSNVGSTPSPIELTSLARQVSSGG